MEVFGVFSGVLTILPLLNTCLDAFDMIQEGRNHDFVFRMLLVRLNVERIRLHSWGTAITTTESQTGIPNRHITHEGVIQDLLQVITSLLIDAVKIQARYGCIEVDVPEPDQEPTASTSSESISHLAAPFTKLKLLTGTEATSNTKGIIPKTRWQIRDKKKFEQLIRDIQECVDGIYKITRPMSIVEMADRNTNQGLYKIEDVETLTMVSAACQTDYPSFSDTASEKLDELSQSGSQSGGIVSRSNRNHTRSASREMIRVPILNPRRTRVSKHSNSPARLIHEKILAFETLICPLTEEETQRVDEVILTYLDYRHFTVTADAFRREIQNDMFSEMIIDRNPQPSAHGQRISTTSDGEVISEHPRGRRGRQVTFRRSRRQVTILHMSRAGRDTRDHESDNS
jgi:hypothetical protein